MATTYTRDQLNRYNREEVRAIASRLGIRGMWHARKDAVVDAILASQRPQAAAQAQTQAAPQAAPLSAISGQFTSVVSNPNGPVGGRTTTTIRVSCGASASNFPVVGKTVGAVAELLREVLNVDRLAQGVVNGQVVQDNYVLGGNDTLEFLKPAGRKG